MISQQPKASASRRQRRLLVLLAAAMVSAVAAIGLLDLPRWLSLAVIIGYWVAAQRLDATVGRPMRARAGLDERQRAEYDRVHRVAYRAMSLLLLFALIPALLLDGEVWPDTAVRTVPMVLLGGLAIVHLLLPQAILAWSQPDPLETEGDEPLTT